jgi:Carboxypeptidase regulatory-like domain
MKSHSISVATLMIVVLGVDAFAAETRAAEVTGRVTYQGKPLADAKVSFHPKKGKPVTTKTAADGTFRFKSIAAGTMVVTVKSKVLPKKYASPKTSGLKFDVGSEDNQLIIDLK